MHMPNVHPTAILTDEVNLADDVEIGPGCIIDGPVTIGPGCRLIHRVSLRGPITLGSKNILYPNVCIGFPPQDVKVSADHRGAGVVMGDHNVLRENVTIHGATKEQPTRLGNHSYLMCGAHMGHDCIVGDHCMLANQVLLAGHVTLEDRAIMGGNAVVHQFCRIGEMVMMSGSTGVVQDIPPFCVTYRDRSVGSLNIVGLRRAGLREHIKPLEQAFDIIYKQRHTVPVALDLVEQAQLKDPLVDRVVAFIRSTKRGISPYEPSSRRHGA